MKPQLHLHIGHGKVASSSIQVTLHANVDALREQGFLLADHDLSFPTSGRIKATPGAYLARLREEGEEGLADFLRRMERALAAAHDTGKKLLMSSEHMVVSPMEVVAAPLAEHFELHMYYYVRRQADWLVSAWKQWGIKEGRDLEEFVAGRLAGHRPDFRRVVERWEPHATSFRVRPLHRSALHQGDIVADFFHAIGCVPRRTDLPSINRSFDLSLLEAMAASSDQFDGLHDDRIFQFLERNLPRDLPVERAALEPATEERIRAQFEEDNRDLHARFFPDCDFDAVFGPREARPVTSTDLQRIRRALGLQLGLAQRLDERLREVERRLDERTRPE